MGDKNTDSKKPDFGITNKIDDILPIGIIGAEILAIGVPDNSNKRYEGGGLRIVYKLKSGEIKMSTFSFDEIGIIGQDEESL